MDMGIFVTLLVGFHVGPLRSDHRIVQVNFVSWEQMIQRCSRFNSRALGCYDGQIWTAESHDLNGRYTVALALDFVSWNDLKSVCEKPACTIDGTIIASRSFNKRMNCTVGELVFKQMGWPQKMYNTQCIVGHEVIHAFGEMHPYEN